MPHTAYLRSGMGVRRRDADCEGDLAGVEGKAGNLRGHLRELRKRLHGAADNDCSGEADQHDAAQ